LCDGKNDVLLQVRMFWKVLDKTTKENQETVTMEGRIEFNNMGLNTNLTIKFLILSHLMKSKILLIPMETILSNS
jgi:hypothetical protein